MLFVVVLQVAICHNVIVSLSRDFVSFAAKTLLFSGLGALVGRLEVMILLIEVAYDVVVSPRVLAGFKVPRLLLRVVSMIFKTLELVVEVQDVISLLISE